MVSKKLEEALNLQLNKELYSEYLYLSIRAWFLGRDLEGFGNWMDVQTKEEHVHAMKFYDFIVARNAKVTLTAIDAPPVDFTMVQQAFEYSLDHEKFVTKSINELMDLAIKESDHAAASFLKWFVDEQVEEESNFTKVLNKVKMAGESGPGLFMIDQELAKRVFVAPAPAADAGAAA